jgi:hypothetical protein
MLNAALWNDGLGHYDWGTSTIWFSPIASVYRMSPIQLFANWAQGHAAWRTDAEFRQTVAVLHELVHYQQDLTTGVGHWDYVQRKSANRWLLSVARTASRIRGLPKSLFTNSDHAKNFFLDAFNKSLFNEWPSQREREQADLREVISKNPAYHPDAADYISMETILETEAILSVFSYISTLPLSPEQTSTADNNSSIYVPPLMPLKYRRLFNSIHNSMTDKLALDTDEDFSIFVDAHPNTLTALYDFYLWIVDSCLAYPPPSYFDRTGDDPLMFHPGIKLLHYEASWPNISALSCNARRTGGPPGGARGDC